MPDKLSIWMIVGVRMPFLEKAIENTEAAELCLNAGHTNACVNRVYYSMYQAALASLIHYNYASVKGDNRHDWVQSEFAKRLIKERKIYPGLQGYLTQAIELRIQADYQEKNVSQKQARRLLSKAKQFFNTIKENIT